MRIYICCASLPFFCCLIEVQFLQNCKYFIITQYWAKRKCIAWRWGIDYQGVKIAFNKGKEASSIVLPKSVLPHNVASRPLFLETSQSVILVSHRQSCWSSLCPSNVFEWILYLHKWSCFLVNVIFFMLTSTLTATL